MKTNGFYEPIPPQPVSNIKAKIIAVCTHKPHNNMLDQQKISPNLISPS